MTSPQVPTRPIPDPAVELRGVCFTRDGTPILDAVDWTVRPGERWVVLGPNGSGKTTLVRIATLWEHPSSGTVEVLGERLGHTDVRMLRRRIGVSSAGLTDRLRADLVALDVVMTGRRAALEPWWHPYDDEDRDAASAALDTVGCAELASHRFGTLSSGERQRVLLARALVNDPSIVVLDEPAAGLDVGGRELLMSTLEDLARRHRELPLVLVTHHLEEIPPGWTHALVLCDGEVAAAGAIDDVLDEGLLCEVFGVDLEVTRHAGRYSARRRDLGDESRP